MSTAHHTVIFLDIDGVLVPVSPMSFGGGDIEPECVDRLAAVVQAAGGADAVTIVLSSTWRHDAEKIKRLNGAFAKASPAPIPATSRGVPDGVPNPTPLESLTYLKKDPNERKLVCARVDEIHEWLRVNAAEFAAAASGGRWLAIDDMDLGLDQRMAGHFVKTDTEEGMLRGDVATALAVIAKLPPAPPAAAVAASATEAAAVQAPLGAAHSAAVASSAAASKLPVGVVLLGTVKRYNPTRGFGFVSVSVSDPTGERAAAPAGAGAEAAAGEDESEDVFVHQTSIKHEGFRALNVGQRVRFVVAVENGLRQAVEVEQLTPYVPLYAQRRTREAAAAAAAAAALPLSANGAAAPPKAAAKPADPPASDTDAAAVAPKPGGGKKKAASSADATALESAVAAPASAEGGESESDAAPPGVAADGDAPAKKSKSQKKRARKAAQKAAASGATAGSVPPAAGADPTASRPARPARSAPVVPPAMYVDPALALYSGAALYAPPFGYVPPVITGGLPLLPDGQGFRAVNGTVFYPQNMAPPDPATVPDEAAAPPQFFAPRFYNYANGAGAVPAAAGAGYTANVGGANRRLRKRGGM